MSDTAAQPADASPVGLFRHLWAAGGLAASVALLSGLSAQPARAFVQITLTETSSGVNAAITGSANLDNLALVTTVRLGGTSIARPSATDFISIGPADKEVDLYSGLTGPTSFGTGTGQTDAPGTLATGGGFAFWANGLVPVGGGAQLGLPKGYTSGSSLNASASFPGQTFATLGLTPGSYDWTWGTGPDQRVNLSIGAIAVPAPLPIFGAAAVFGYSRKLRKRIKHGKRPPVAEA